MAGIYSANTPPQEYVYNSHNVPFEDLMDIAFVFEKRPPSLENNLDEDENPPEAVLARWKETLEGYHIIIIGELICFLFVVWLFILKSFMRFLFLAIS